MSDLISRSALLEIIEKMNFDFGNDSDDTETIIEMVSEAVNNQPTAYDVEKVVEQLKDKLTCEDFGTCGYCQNRWCTRELLDADDAIEIVRKGGIE